MGGKSGGSDSQTITNRVDVPKFLRPFVHRQARIGADALGRLEGQLSGAGADQLIAGFDPLQEQAMQLAVQRAQGAGGFIPTAQQQFLQTAQGVPIDQFVGTDSLGALRSSARGDFLFGGQGFDQAVQAAIRAAQPQVASIFGRSGAGTSGLARAAIGEAATDAFARQFAQERLNQLNASNVLADLGQGERQRQLAAAGALPGIGLADVGILQDTGGIRQAMAQRQLTAPISAQEALLQAVGGGVPLGSVLGQTQTSTSPLHRNIGAGVLGGGLAGLGLAQGLFPASAAAREIGGLRAFTSLSPLTLGLAAGGGALLGLLS